MEWNNQEFITLFFEECIKEPDRKYFWLNYAIHIEYIWLAGSSLDKSMLQSNPKIKEYLEGRFKNTNSLSNNGGVIALIMQIKDYFIIEFSKTGNALYVYKKNSKENDINLLLQSDSIPSIASFKKKGMNQLCNNFPYKQYQEGCLAHLYTWKEDLAHWMFNYLQIDPNRLNQRNDTIKDSRPSKPIESNNPKVSQVSKSIKNTEVLNKNSIHELFIKVFFKQCTNKSDRRDFWLYYAQHIESIWISGSPNDRKLLADTIIKSYLNTHFKETKDLKYVAVLIIEIKGYFFIEFSGLEDFLYLYSKQHSMSKRIQSFIEGDSISVQKLRLKELDIVSSYTLNNNEGRLPHEGNWQAILARWMGEHLQI